MLTQEDLKNIKDGLVELTADRNVQDVNEETWQSILNTLDKVESLLDSPEKEVITVKGILQVLSTFDEDMEVFVCINEDGSVITHNIFSINEHREGCGIFI